jgi:predicted Zn-dependent peptidase
MAILETGMYGVPYDFREKEKYIKKITKKDIQEAAQKYLTDDYVLTVLEPEKAG